MLIPWRVIDNVMWRLRIQYCHKRESSHAAVRSNTYILFSTLFGDVSMYSYRLLPVKVIFKRWGHPPDVAICHPSFWGCFFVKMLFILLARVIIRVSYAPVWFLSCCDVEQVFRDDLHLNCLHCFSSANLNHLSLYSRVYE